MEKQEVVALIKNLMNAYGLTVEDIIGISVQSRQMPVKESYVAPQPQIRQNNTQNVHASIWDTEDPVVSDDEAQSYVDAAFPAPTLDDK